MRTPEEAEELIEEAAKACNGVFYLKGHYNKHAQGRDWEWQAAYRLVAKKRAAFIPMNSLLWPAIRIIEETSDA